MSQRPQGIALQNIAAADHNRVVFCPVIAVQVSSRAAPFSVAQTDGIGSRDHQRRGSNPITPAASDLLGNSRMETDQLEEDVFQVCKCLLNQLPARML